MVSSLLIPLSGSFHSIGAGVTAAARDAWEVPPQVFLASLMYSLQGFLQLDGVHGEIITSLLSPPLKAHYSSTPKAMEAFLVQPSISHRGYLIATTGYSRQAHSGFACRAKIGEPNRLGSAISEYRLLGASFQK